MDTPLYDEFGNYIGPDLDENEEDLDDQMDTSRFSPRPDEDGDVEASNNMDIVEHSSNQGTHQLH